MKQVLLGASLSTVLLLLLTGLFSASEAVSAPRPLGENGMELITLTAAAGDSRQQITVIDPQMRVMCVYHTDLNTGHVALKCVRNIHWDLQMEYFNGESPLPREIRTLIETR